MLSKYSHLYVLFWILTATFVVFNVHWAHAGEAGSVDATISSVRDRLHALQTQSADREPAVRQPAAEPPLEFKTKSTAVPRKLDRSPASRKVQVAPPAPPVSRPSVPRETQSENPVEESPQEEETRLTKNWGGARKAVSDRGIDLGLTYKAEWNRNFSGGLRREGTYLGNLDFKVSLDGEKLAGLRGASAFIYVLTVHGGHPSSYVGDSQVTSNIDAPASTSKVYEAWVQQMAFDSKVSLLVGLHDLNSEFYVTDSSGLFFNSSFGVGKDLSQSGFNGPSIFPTTSLALRMRVEPTQDFYFQTAAFGARSGSNQEPRGTQISMDSRDGLLLISEFGYLRGRASTSQLAGKYALGAWSYTEPFAHLTESVFDSSGAQIPARAGSHGLYLLADQGVSDSFSAFLRLGIASPAVNRFNACLGLGVVATGWIPTRSKDRMGLALAAVSTGAPFSEAQAALGAWVPSVEGTFEFNYRAQIVPGIAIQPDLQYVIHPGTALGIPDALVGAARMELNF